MAYSCRYPRTMLYEDRPDRTSGYETALICLSGHIITGSIQRWPQDVKERCASCGEGTIRACPQCTRPIDGDQKIGSFISHIENAPHFCSSCGAAYPWTQAKQQALRDLVDLLTLSEDQKVQLRKDMQDVTRDIPNAKVAAYRIKKLIDAMGSSDAEVLRSCLKDVAPSNIVALLEA